MRWIASGSTRTASNSSGATLLIENVQTCVVSTGSIFGWHDLTCGPPRYDILIDDTLKPWLIEVNSSPSLARENELDHQVKNQVVADTLRLNAPPPFDRAALRVKPAPHC